MRIPLSDKKKTTIKRNFKLLESGMFEEGHIKELMLDLREPARQLLDLDSGMPTELKVLLPQFIDVCDCIAHNEKNKGLLHDNIRKNVQLILDLYEQPTKYKFPANTFAARNVLNAERIATCLLLILHISIGSDSECASESIKTLNAISSDIALCIISLLQQVVITWDDSLGPAAALLNVVIHEGRYRLYCDIYSPTLEVHNKRKAYANRNKVLGFPVISSEAIDIDGVLPNRHSHWTAHQRCRRPATIEVYRGEDRLLHVRIDTKGNEVGESITETGRIYATAITLTQNGRINDAVDCYKKLLAIDPNHVLALTNYACILSKHMENAALVKQLFEHAFKLALDSSITLSNYATTLETSNPQLANECYQKSLELDPNHLNTLIKYGRFIHLKLNDKQSSAEKFKKAIKIAPNHPILLDYYAELLKEDGHPKPAEKMYLRAIAADANSPHHLGNYALLLQSLGRLVEAEDYFKKSISIDPHQATILTNYAILLFSMRKDPILIYEMLKKAAEMPSIDNYSVHQFNTFKEVFRIL